MALNVIKTVNARRVGIRSSEKSSRHLAISLSLPETAAIIADLHYYTAHSFSSFTARDQQWGQCGGKSRKLEFRRANFHCVTSRRVALFIRARTGTHTRADTGRFAHGLARISHAHFYINNAPKLSRLSCWGFLSVPAKNMKRQSRPAARTYTRHMRTCARTGNAYARARTHARALLLPSPLLINVSI